MSDRIITVSRDPFAREEIVRAVVDQGQSCDWCGGKNAYGKLFVYGVRSDSVAGRIHWQRGAFCCVGCYRTYHG